MDDRERERDRVPSASCLSSSRLLLNVGARRRPIGQGARISGRFSAEKGNQWQWCFLSFFGKCVNNFLILID
jgi:hypothetical protein